MTSHADVAQRLCGARNQLNESLAGTNMSYSPESEAYPARIFGYDWAVYAVRIDDTVIIDTTWRGYSASTTKHMTILERAARRSDHVNLAYVRGIWRSTSYGRGGGGRHKTTEDILEALPWNREELPKLGPTHARAQNHAEARS